MAVPPGRMIYRVDPKTWTVEHSFPTVGYRPHGIGIETPDAKYLWESDTNMGAFFKRDGERKGVLHGASAWKTFSSWVFDLEGLFLRLTVRGESNDLDLRRGFKKEDNRLSIDMEPAAWYT